MQARVGDDCGDIPWKARFCRYFGCAGSLGETWAAIRRYNAAAVEILAVRIPTAVTHVFPINRVSL